MKIHIVARVIGGMAGWHMAKNGEDIRRLLDVSGSSTSSG